MLFQENRKIIVIIMEKKASFRYVKAQVAMMDVQGTIMVTAACDLRRLYVK